MPPTKQPPPPGKTRIGPLTGGFVAVVAVLGAVTRIFGMDAGLVALVLTVVALVVLPQVFGGRPARGNPDADPATGWDADGALDVDRAADPADPEDGTGPVRGNA